MARIKWVQQRLENWGMWASRGGSGSGGFATRSVLGRLAEPDVWARNRCGGSVIPVCEAEALETDRAIASFKDTRPAIAKALILVYVYDFGVVEAAYREKVGQSTMHARLGQADQAIAMWLEDRAAEMQKRREAARGSFTP